MSLTGRSDVSHIDAARGGSHVESLQQVDILAAEVPKLRRALLPVEKQVCRLPFHLQKVSCPLHFQVANWQPFRGPGDICRPD
jgi:hypothetical protein